MQPYLMATTAPARQRQQVTGWLGGAASCHRHAARSALLIVRLTDGLPRMSATAALTPLAAASKLHVLLGRHPGMRHARGEVVVARHQQQHVLQDYQHHHQQGPGHTTDNRQHATVQAAAQQEEAAVTRALTTAFRQVRTRPVHVPATPM